MEMSLRCLLSCVSNIVLFSVQEHCFMSRDQCEKLCESKNNAPTSPLLRFLLFRQNLLLFFSCLSLRTCKPHPFVPPVPHCALFNPSCPFSNMVLTCDILLHTPADWPSNKADKRLKRCQPVHRMMQRASTNLPPSDGHRQRGAWAFCTNTFCDLFIFK